MLKLDLQQLYSTIVVGKSACHGYTKSPGHTGGFYHIVCPHGLSRYIQKAICWINKVGRDHTFPLCFSLN